MILLDRITKTYPGDEEPALDNVSLHIEPHEFVFLVGKSGAGKSTLIKMITKEEQPDSGKIIIGGIDLDYVKKRHIPHYRRRLGVVFQDYKLLPTRTVFENVAFALEIAGMSGRDIARTVPKVLDLVGLENKANKFPNCLSGGERQRVSIARSVARQPKILIADEPTGNLDKLTKKEIIELLQRINDFGTTLLVTTHDESIVNNLSKRVVTLKAGQIVDDQKHHGVYRLDSKPEPEVDVVEKVIVPGSKRIITGREQLVVNSFGGTVPSSGSLRSSQAMRDTGLKIQHTQRRTASTGGKSVRPTSQANIQSPKTAMQKALAHDSANQWYTASRPLKAAPRLSDFSLGQTVKLKPAPSMMQNFKKQPANHKIRQKRVI